MFQKAMEWLWENIHPMFITDPSAESSKAEAGESADRSEMAEFNITDPNAELSKAEAGGLAEEGSEELKVETRLPIVGDLTRAFCREDEKYHAAVVTDGPSVEGSYKVVFFAFQRTEYESREENVSSQEIEPTGTHLPIINYRLGNPSTGVTTFAIITFPSSVSCICTYLNFISQIDKLVDLIIKSLLVRLFWKFAGRIKVKKL